VTGHSQVWVGTGSHSDLTTAGHHMRM